MVEKLPAFAPEPAPEQTYSQPESPGFFGTAKDYGLEIGAGYTDISAGVAGGLGNLFDSQKLRNASELLSYVSEVVRDQQSEVGKQARGASWTGQEGRASAWSTPIRSAGMTLAGVLPQMAATATMSPAAGAALWGADAAGRVSAEAIKDTGDRTDDELRAQYGTYREARDRGASEQEARRDLIATRAGIVPTAIGAGAGVVGGYSLGRAFHPAAEPWRRRVARHLTEGAAGEFVDSAGGETARQTGEIAARGQEDYDWGKIAREGAEGAVLGGVIGGVAGAVTKQHAVEPDKAAALGKFERDVYEEMPGGSSRRRAVPRRAPVSYLNNDDTWNYVDNPYARQPTPQVFGSPSSIYSQEPREQGAADYSWGNVGTPPGAGDFAPDATGAADPGKPARRKRGGGGQPPTDGAPPPTDGGPAPTTPPAAPDPSLGPLPSVPTRGPASAVPGVAPQTTGSGLAAMTMNGRHHAVVVLPEPGRTHTDGQFYRLVEGPGGTARQWVRADNLEMLPDWMREQAAADPGIVERYMANRPAPQERPAPAGNQRVFGEPEQAPTDYSWEYQQPPDEGTITGAAEPARSTREAALEKEIADLEATIALWRNREEDPGGRPERVPSGDARRVAAKDTRTGVGPGMMTLRKGQYVGLGHQTNREVLAAMSKDLAGLHAQLAEARAQGDVERGQIPPVAETRTPVAGRPPPSVGFAYVGEQVNPRTRAAQLQVGDRVRGPEGDTLKITKIGTGADPLLSFTWEGDARGAQPGAIRRSVLARSMEAHEYTDPRTGETRRVPEATVIPASDRSRPGNRIRVFGPKEGPLARDNAADLRRLTNEEPQPDLRSGQAVEGGVGPTAEQGYIPERKLPEHKPVMTKGEQAKAVAQELRRRGTTREEARRMAEAEVLRDAKIGKREREPAITRLTEEILAGDIDIARLRRPEPDERRPGESEADRRKRLNIPTPELPPRPGSPEDLARIREASARPANARELAGREPVQNGRPVTVHHTVDVGARQQAIRDRIEKSKAARKEAAEEADKERRRVSSQGRQDTKVDSAEAAIGKVFDRARRIMKSFSQENFWKAIAPGSADLGVPKRVKGGKAARAQALAAARGPQTEAAREKLLADARSLVEKLKEKLGGKAFSDLVAAGKARRTAKERRAGVTTHYPNRYIARALYQLVRAHDAVQQNAKKTGQSDAAVMRIMNQHFVTFRKSLDELAKEHPTAFDPVVMSDEQRAAAQAEMSPEQKRLDDERRAELGIEDDEMAAPPSEQLAAHNKAVEDLEQLSKARENAMQQASAMVAKAERELKNLLDRVPNKLASKFKQESSEIKDARKARDDARTKEAKAGGELQATLDALDEAKAARDDYVSVDHERSGEEDIGGTEAAEEEAGGNVETTARGKRRKARAPSVERAAARTLSGDELKARIIELTERQNVRKRESAGEPPTVEALDNRYGEAGETVHSTADVEVERAVSDIRSHADAEPPAERGKAHAVADLLEALARRFQQVIGNTPVRVVDSGTLAERHGGSPKGIFQSEPAGALAGGERGIIWLGREDMTGPSGPHTVLHETAHAATDHAIEANPGIKRDLAELGRHLKNFLDNNPLAARRYNLTAQDAIEVQSLGDAHELLAIAKSNPNLQRAMIELAAPTRIRAKYGLSKNASMWDGFVNAIARMFNLTRAEYSTLDAVLSINDELAAYVPPRTGTTVNDLVALSEGRRGTPESNFRALFGPEIAALKDKLVDTRTNTGSALQRFYRMVAPTRSLAETAQRYFTPIADDARGRNHYSMAVETQQRMATERQNILENEILPTAEKARALHTNYSKGDHWANFEKYHLMKSQRQIDGSKTLEKQTRLPTEKGKPKPDNTGRHLSPNDTASDAQKRANYAEVRALWESLPEDLQQLDREASAIYAKDNAEMGRRLLRNMIDISRPRGTPRMNDRAAYALVDRMLGGTMTEAEQAQYGKGSLFRSNVRDARALSSVGGPWSPQQRHGNWVVRGRYKIDPMGGQRLGLDGKPDPNGEYFQFNSEPERRAFDIANKEHKSSGHSTVYFDKDGKPMERKAGKKAFAAGNATAKYNIRLQDRYVAMHQTAAEAARDEAELRRMVRDEGLQMEVYGVEPRKWEPEEAAQSYLSQPQIRALKEMRQTPHYQELDPASQRLLDQAQIEMAVRAMSSTRVQSKRIKRKYVEGASSDFMQNFQTYASSAADYRTHLEHMPTFNDHIHALEEEMAATPYLGSEFKSVQRGLLDELRKRFDVRDRRARSEIGQVADKATARLMQLTSSAKLGSPAYHITNLLEPDMFAAPLFDADFGNGSGFRLLRRAERLLGVGDTLGTGLNETWKAIKGEHRRPDYTKTIVERVKNDPVHGKELAELITEAGELGGIARGSGLEVYQILMPSESLFGKGVDYFDNVSRQMSLADEAVNRAKVLVGGYVGARESGMTVEQAKHYALDKNLKSMGDYSTWNTAPIFRGNLGRIMFQFKKFGMKSYDLLGHQIADVLNSDLPKEERIKAAKAFGHVLWRHALMAGAVGLPLEPIRLALITAGIVGLGYSYEDFQADIRSTASDLLGKDAGQIIAGGLPRYFGLDMSTRSNLDQLLSPYDPKSTKPDDTMQYLASIVFGASGDQIKGYFRGVQALTEGKLADFAAQMAPLKTVHDSIVAAQNASNGGALTPSGKKRTSPPDFWENITTAAGFRSGQVAEEGDYRNALLREKAQRNKERISIVQDYVNAENSDARNAAWKRAMRYNSDKAGPERITLGTLEKSRRNRDRAQDEFGVSVGRREGGLRDLRQYYNVGP